MKTIRAVYENGVFRPTEPLELPERSLVEFEPRPLGASGAYLNPDVTDEIPSGRSNNGRLDLGAIVEGSACLREEDWPETPEGIARHLALMDRIEPMDFSPEEAADWESARTMRRDLEKAAFDERAEALRKGWE